MYRFLKPADIHNYNRRSRALLRLFCNRRSFSHIKDRDPVTSNALLKRNFITDNTPLVKQYCSCSILGNTFQNVRERAPISSQIDDVATDSNIDELLQDIDIKCNQTMKKSKHELINDMVNKKLSSYVEFCVECDFLHFAFNAIDRHVKKHRYDRVTRITTSRPFVKLMSGFAAKGDLQKVVKLMEMMEACDIDPTPSTYACYLECFGRNGITPSDDEFEVVTNGCKSLGLTLAELESQMTHFNIDSRKYTSEAIRAVHPDFVPLDESPVLRYTSSNSLVRDLNEKPKLFRAPCERLLSGEKMDELADEQINNELEDVLVIKSVGNRAKRDDWKALLHHWRSVVREAFVQDLQQEENSLEQRLLTYEPNVIPYLKYLTVDQYVDIVFTEIHLLLQDYELRKKDSAILNMRLGDAVLRRCKVEHARRKWTISTMSSFYKNYCRWLVGCQSDDLGWNARRRWQRMVHENGNVDPFSGKAEPSPMREAIGEFFYRIIMKHLLVRIGHDKSGDKKPLWAKAFYRTCTRRRECFVEKLEVHAKVLELMSGSDFYVHISELPMIAPPLPKISPQTGDFVLFGENYTRASGNLYDSSQSVPNEQLYPIFDAKNILSSVPWQINKPVYELMQSIFDKGGSHTFDVPIPLSKFELDSKYVTSLCENVKLSNKALKNLIEVQMGRTFRLWREMSNKLWIAREYADRIFWLPYVLDNRGRMSCTLPYLSHFKGDSTRALLRFSKGVKLGDRGLDWLKVHCINLSGVQKFVSIKQKLKYFDENVSGVLDSAEKPFTGNLWWTKGENKWQTLACCMEIRAALESGDPANFVSHLPVHRDGTCNVLQHFAALARDERAGEYANLTPSSRPQDAYTNIIGLLEYNRRQRAGQGDKDAQSTKGFFHRKNIKPLVIASLNGGSRDELYHMARRALSKEENINPEQIKSHATYLVNHLTEQLDETFKNSRDVKTWLMECSEVITGKFEDQIEWETPLGFLVKQRHRKNLIDIDVEKQMKSFMPNFIQSLESTHMILTSLYCERAGITFVSVFDCFWTHAGSVHVMDKICREQFVAMHSQPILENLSKNFIRKHAADSLSNDGKVDLPEESPFHVFTRVPPKGTLDLNQVLESEYFFC